MAKEIMDWVKELLALLVPAFIAYMTWRLAVVNQKVTAVDVKVDKVNDGTKVIHTLINHDRHIILESNAIALRAVAELTGKESDRTRATVAEKALVDHDEGQKISDAKDNPADKVPTTVSGPKAN